MEEMLRNEGLKRVRMRLITVVAFVFTQGRPKGRTRPLRRPGLTWA